MKLSNMTPAAIAALFAASMSVAMPVQAQTNPAAERELAVQPLAQGESVRAIAMLKTALEEAPGDPALLINLGIAYAQGGNDAEARASFEAAMASREVIELEMANGATMDSRRLARRALAMLDRGEFQQRAGDSSRLTLRQ
ncbi:tetratricopeptide repeat protein [Erythrobacter aurantius]|uniref:tetratricopeptide repeat protein n=1 Tax=Erythrobacter aurantius TaxID=2909249 RepID=UPI00207A3B92|nr:tetratricopeptide repeat protein [Erythrobacter aurantius]